jgi:hypothetical protein
MLSTANVINLYSAVSRMKCANRQRGTISATRIPFASLTLKKKCINMIPACPEQGIFVYLFTSNDTSHILSGQ